MTETGKPETSALKPSVEGAVALPVQVMVVDDSAVIRGFLTRYLESDPNIQVVTSVSNGEMALASLKRKTVDVVVLDIEMPVMDGLTALPKILEIDPDIQVIMASTLTTRNASVTMEALHKGAADALAKPTSTAELSGESDFKRELIEKVRVLGGVARKKREGKPHVPLHGAVQVTAAALARVTKFSMRHPGFSGRPDVIAIGSSTGGPQALQEVLKAFGGKKIQQPIFITQHMPATFTAILATHISKNCNVQCNEAKDGEEVQGGIIYLAPGGYHMTVRRTASGKPIIALNQDPPENFCRPAVDPMLRSLINTYGQRILVAILTGMGADGAKACQTVVDKGGTVIAQDEASSVVWGMPGAVAAAGLCSNILPLKDMGAALARAAMGQGVA